MNDKKDKNKNKEKSDLNVKAFDIVKEATKEVPKDKEKGKTSKK